MTSTYSPSLRLELMGTGDQSGTWGVTTNTNLGTLLEQAITGYLSVAQGDVANLTLTALDGTSDQARNAVVDITGALTANRNVVVPTAEKLYFMRNLTTGGYTITVKTTAGTGITIPPNTGRWVVCDGTNVVDMYATAFTPSADDNASLGLAAVGWSDLFLASGAVLNWSNGDVTVTHALNTLTFAGASSGYLFSNVVAPTANDGAPLGAASDSWSDLFLASGGVVNWNNGTYTMTQSGSTMLFSGGVLPATNDAAALGSATVSWGDLFLASGGVINWNNGTYTATQSGTTLALSGSLTTVGNVNAATYLQVTNATFALRMEANTGSANNISSYNNPITAYQPLNIDASQFDFRINASATVGAALTSATLRPKADDGLTLGVSGTAWSDLFLASGGVVDWNAGNITLTQGSGGLVLSGSGTPTFQNAGGVNMATASDGWSLSAQNQLIVSRDGNSAAQFRRRTSNGSVIQFYQSTTVVGSIDLTSTTTTYTTSSDYRRKPGQAALVGYWERLLQVLPKSWLWDGNSGTPGRGFVAHEFQVPYAQSVTGEKDAVDNAGKPVYQQLDPATPEVVADIIAALQDIYARLQAAGL